MPILLDGFLGELHDRNTAAVTDSRSATLEADLDHAVFAPESQAALDVNAPLPVQVACVTTAFADLTARLSSLTESSPIEVSAEVDRLFSTNATYDNLYTRVKKELNRTTRRELDLRDLELDAAARSRHELQCLHALLSAPA